jgi:hypothetical protein
LVGVGAVVDEELEWEDSEDVKDKPSAEVVLEDQTAGGNELAIVSEVGGVERDEDVQEEQAIEDCVLREPGG